MKYDSKIMLKKDVILNKNLSNNAILTYIGLAICLKPGMDLVYADKNMLYYYLSGMSSSIPRRFEESLKNGLNELIDNNIIKCKKKYSTSYYFIADDFTINKDDTYVVIYLSEINKIICCDYKGKISLLRYYVCLLTTFIIKNSVKDIRDPDKYNNILGMISQEYIADLANVSIHTVIEYTKLLEQLELLYISRCSFIFKDGVGKVKRHNNIYGRYKDKEIIDDFTNVRYEMYDDLHKTHISSVANKSRSLMQKYNCLRNGVVYDQDTVNEIYKHICEYNEKHPKKAKDMSVFGNLTD